MTNFNHEGNRNDGLRPWADNGIDPGSLHARPDESINAPPSNSESDARRNNQMSIRAGEQQVEPAARRTGGMEVSQDFSGTKPPFVATAPSSIGERLDGSNATLAPFMKTLPVGWVFAGPADIEGVPKNASKVFRDKYAEVMRVFRSGRLRSPLSHIIKERAEARSIAAYQARQFEAGSKTQEAI